MTSPQTMIARSKGALHPAIPSLLLSVALGACVSSPQLKPVPLPLDTPTEWVSGETEAPAASAALDQVAPNSSDTWWKSFENTELNTIVQQVLESNRDLAVAVTRVDAAAALASIAGADKLPQIGATVTSSRRRQNFIGLPIPGSTDRTLSTTTTSHNPLLSVSWEVDLWNRIGAAQGAALLDYRASAADLNSARLSLAAQAGKAWFGIIGARGQVALAEETLTSRQTTAERIHRRYNLGLRPALEVRLANSNAAAAQANLSRRRQQLAEAIRRLEILLDRYPRGNSELASTVAKLPPMPAPPPAGLPSTLIDRRTDLIAARQRLDAAGLRTHAAKAALYPQVRLTGSAGRVSQDLDDLLDNQFSVWSLAANLLQPIFQAGRLKAGLELANAHQTEALHNYARTVLVAFREVESALSAQKYLEQQEAALAEAVRQASAAEHLAQDRYNAGLSGYLEFLVSQRQATTVKSQLLEIQLQRLNARIDLHLALGGDITHVAEV